MRASASVWILLAAASLGMAQVQSAGVPGTNPAKSAGIQAPAGTMRTVGPLATSQPPKRAAGSSAPGKAAADQKKGTLAALVSKPTPAKQGAEQLTAPPRLVLKRGAGKRKPSTETVSISEDQAKPGARFANKRDPFVSVIRAVSTGQPTCVSGKKCLVISQVNLKGVVRSGDDKFAVVEDGQKRTFFLRENDPVFNGQVVRITSDEILFRETVMDRVGRTFPREIVKKLPKG